MNDWCLSQLLTLNDNASLEEMRAVCLPTKSQQAELATQGGITVQQVVDWFQNQRNRHMKPKHYNHLRETVAERRSELLLAQTKASTETQGDEEVQAQTETQAQIQTRTQTTTGSGGSEGDSVAK